MSYSGGLPPSTAALDIFTDALHHLSEPLHLTFLHSIHGGALLSTSGILSQILSTGTSGLASTNPALPRLLAGLTFPLGLVIIYLVGAELYTGYPMWYSIALLSRRGHPAQYIRGPLTSWAGNLLGALLVAYFFSTLAGTLTVEPYRSGVLAQVRENIVEPAWGVVFVRAVGCGWLVTLAMYLGTQQKDGVSKALVLHLPFFVSVTAGFPHTVEFMFLGLLGLFLQGRGASGAGGVVQGVEGGRSALGGLVAGAGAGETDVGFDFGMYVGKCLVPVTLGNAVGGAVGTGAYIWFVHLRDRKQELEKRAASLDGPRTNGLGDGQYSDEG